MFLDLPEDLLLALLSEWLPESLLALSHLDVACCNRASRSCWLEVIRRVRIEEADAAQPIDNFLTWLHDREIMVSRLRVLTDEESWEDLSGLTLSFRTISLKCYRGSLNVHPQPIQTLLSFFPCLTALDVECFDLPGKMFPDLGPCFPPLRQLSLRHCLSVDLSNAMVLISAISPTLEELHCDIMDEQMALTLTEHCRSLRKLSGSFRTATPASIKALCCNNRQLVSVDIKSRYLTNELILSILTACPEVREMVVGSCCNIELLSSQAVQALDSIRVQSILFRMFPCESPRSKRCCEIVVKEECVDMAFLRTFCANTSMTVRGLTFSEKDSVMITADILRIVADAHGHTLEMAKLELINCADEITVQSFIYALERWFANGVTVINLQGCRLLTDAVLPVIERCCPQLTSLYVPFIGFSKEAILQFVMSVIKNKTFFSLDNESRSFIADELREKHFELWRQLKVAQLQ